MKIKTFTDNLNFKELETSWKPKDWLNESVNVCNVLEAKLM